MSTGEELGRYLAGLWNARPELIVTSPAWNLDREDRARLSGKGGLVVGELHVVFPRDPEHGVT